MSNKKVVIFDKLTIFMVLLHVIGLAFVLLTNIGSNRLDIEVLFRNPFAMIAILAGINWLYWGVSILLLKIYFFMIYVVLVGYNSYEIVRKTKKIFARNANTYADTNRKEITLFYNIIYVVITIIEFLVNYKWMGRQ